MNARAKAYCIAILSAILLYSCSSIKIMSDLDDSIDFSQYKTYQYYGWAKESDKLISKFDQDRIENAFGNELAKCKLEYVKENSDLIITLYIVTEQKTKTTANTTHMGMSASYGYGHYRGYGLAYGWGPTMTSSHTTYSEYDYVVGTLIIDIYDIGEKKLVWESVAKGTIIENTKGREERV